MTMARPLDPEARPEARVIRSMTGYGRAEASGEKVALLVEARSLNHRHLEIALKLPRAFSAFEVEARRLIQERLHRGRVEVAATARWPGGGGALAADQALATQYWSEARRLGEALGIPAQPTVEWLLERPGVLVPGEPEALQPEAARALLVEALGRALDDLVACREREGEALAKELLGLHGALAQELERMAARAPAALAQRLARARERLRALLGEIPLDEGRLAMEAAVLADRTDVSEELARLGAHLGQFAALLRDGGPVGRTLDFLVQEMHREVNTVAAKANDLPLSQLTLAAKGHLEKVREQIQNVE
jgi:uncharacterized protein (TIGR00255 family)